MGVAVAAVAVLAVELALPSYPGSAAWAQVCAPGSDPDGDGHCGTDDNCIVVANPGQPDADGDGLGDACDPCPSDGAKTRPGPCGCGQPEPDPDGDGVSSCADNCATEPNADQADSDGDGVGDRCECAGGGCLDGGAARAADCLAQLVPGPSATASGHRTLRCTDGAACDADPTPGICALPVALCFATPDPAALCTPRAPELVHIRGASPAAAEVLLFALASLPTARAVDARAIAYELPVEARSLCTPPFRVPVPVGRERIRLRTQPAGGGPGDTDVFHLVCEAAGGDTP